MQKLIPIVLFSIFPMLLMAQNSARPREMGIKIGVLPVGALNAITDVPGVKVGHNTLFDGSAVRTGVTVILPHAGNLFQSKVPGGRCRWRSVGVSGRG
jgi:D-aminopeptidase